MWMNKLKLPNGQEFWTGYRPRKNLAVDSPCASVGGGLCRVLPGRAHPGEKQGAALQQLGRRVARVIAVIARCSGQAGSNKHEQGQRLHQEAPQAGISELVGKVGSRVAVVAAEVRRQSQQRPK